MVEVHSIRMCDILELVSSNRILYILSRIKDFTYGILDFTKSLESLEEQALD